MFLQMTTPIGTTEKQTSLIITRKGGRTSHSNYRRIWHPRNCWLFGCYVSAKLCNGNWCERVILAMFILTKFHLK